MIHIRAIFYIYGHMLHIRAVCYIYYLRTAWYIYGLYVTYTGLMLHIRAVCYIYGLYVTYTGHMLHIRAVHSKNRCVQLHTKVCLITHQGVFNYTPRCVHFTHLPTQF